MSVLKNSFIFSIKKSKMFKSKYKKMFDEDTILKRQKSIYKINNAPMRFLDKNSI